MPYIKRNAEHKIVAVSQEPLPDFEFVESDDADLEQFLAQINQRTALEQTDLGFIRIVEDVIELLIDKNIILFTELPPAAQKKMLARQHMRSELHPALDLLGEDNQQHKL